MGVGQNSNDITWHDLFVPAPDLSSSHVEISVFADSEIAFSKSGVTRY